MQDTKINDMIRAIEANNEAQVRELIESGTDLTTPLGGESVLAHAARYGNAAIVKQLVSAGATASYDELAELSITPEVREALGSMLPPADLPPELTDLEDADVPPPPSRAAPNVPPVLIDKTTEIIYAINQNNAAKVQELISGADLSIPYEGQSILAYAVRAANTAIVQLLVDAGAAFNALYDKIADLITTPEIREVLGTMLPPTDLPPELPTISVSIEKTPLYKAINTAAKETPQKSLGTLTEEGITFLSAAEKAENEIIERRQAQSKKQVVDLVEQGALAENDGLLAYLIGRTGPDVYMEALGHVSHLSPDAVGLAVIAALQKGDTVCAQMMMFENPNVNLDVQGPNGVTPLMIAAANGLVGFAQYSLIGHIENLNAQDIHGQTALMYAVLMNDAELINVLIAAGADLEVRDKDGRTAFMIALSQSNLEAADSLAEAGADIINVRDAKWMTPLMVAAMHGDRENLSFLIERDLAANVIQDQGKRDEYASAMRIAMDRGDVDFVEFFVEKERVAQAILSMQAQMELKSVTTESALTILEGLGVDIELYKKNPLKAIELGVLERDYDTEDVHAMVTHFRDDYPEDGLFERAVTGHHGRDMDALSFAALTGNLNMLEYLYEYGAEIETKDKDGNTPLMLAAQGGHKACVEFLREKDADIEIAHLDLITFLIRDGGDVKARTMYGDVVTEFLMEHGPKVKIALQIARDIGNTIPLKFLISNGANVGDTIEFAIEERDFDSLMLLIECGAAKEVTEALGTNINIRDKQGQPLLMQIAERGYTEILKDLIQHGANVNAKSPNGRTALIAAVSQGNREVMDILLENKASVNDIDITGNTALSYATDKDTMKILISNGADPYSAHMLVEKDGKHAVNDKAADFTKPVLLDYLAAEQQFKDQFAKKILDGLKKIDAKTVTPETIELLVKQEVAKVLKSEEGKKFAGCFKTGGLDDLGKVPPLSTTGNVFSVFGKQSYEDNIKDRLIVKVEANLTQAMKDASVFKPLDPALDKEVKAHAAESKETTSHAARVGRKPAELPNAQKVTGDSSTPLSR